MTTRVLPLASADAIAHLGLRVYRDPVTRRNTGWRDTDDEEQAVAALTGLWLSRFANDWYVVEVFHADESVGIAGLRPPSEKGGEAWVALYLLVRGKGIGKDVVRTLVEEARTRGAGTVAAVTNEENTGSRRLFESLGFVYDGVSKLEWTAETDDVWVEYRFGL